MSYTSFPITLECTLERTRILNSFLDSCNNGWQDMESALSCPLRRLTTCQSCPTYSWSKAIGPLNGLTRKNRCEGPRSKKSSQIRQSLFLSTLLGFGRAGSMLSPPPWRNHLSSTTSSGFHPRRSSRIRSKSGTGCSWCCSAPTIISLAPMTPRRICLQLSRRFLTLKSRENGIMSTLHTKISRCSAQS